MDEREYAAIEENYRAEIEGRIEKLNLLGDLTNPFMVRTRDIIYRPKADWQELEELKHELSVLEGIMIGYYRFSGKHFDKELYEKICQSSDDLRKISPNAIESMSTRLRSLLEDIAKLSNGEVA